MAKLAFIVSVIAASFILVGCNSNGSGKSSVVTTANDTASSDEVLYAEALNLEKKAGALVKDETLLSMALGKYEQLIAKYPKSNRISDAAFGMARIYEYRKDYANAVINYQRTYQWNPKTPTSARFKTAYILDNHLGRRAEALQIYQEALANITRSNEHRQWVELAEQRVKELTGEVKPQQ
jgi:tetratricopeptide (TPR) repeat protein